MLADFFTKPLQGGLFHAMRDLVQGLIHPDDLISVVSSIVVKEERVEAKLERVSFALPNDKQTKKEEDSNSRVTEE